MPTIKLTVKSSKHTVASRYDARFEPVRKVRVYTIGWATIERDGAVLRFPVIHDDVNDRTATVADWQAPPSIFARDLADPAQVARQIACGQGRFVTSSWGPSAASKYFVV